MNSFKDTYVHRLTEATSKAQCPTSCPVGTMADAPELGDAFYTADGAAVDPAAGLLALLGLLLQAYC